MSINNRRLHISHYQFKTGERLFIDTNVWLYTNGPLSYAEERKPYSNAFKEIWNSCDLFIDLTVVSEFINAYSRIELKRKFPDSKPKDFKVLRNSSEYLQTAHEIVEELGFIIDKCQKVESSFKDLDMQYMLSFFQDNAVDFNDQIILEECRRNNLALITHDGDFRHADIPIITANEKLLQ